MFLKVLIKRGLLGFINKFMFKKKEEEQGVIGIVQDCKVLFYRIWIFKNVIIKVFIFNII